MRGMLSRKTIAAILSAALVMSGMTVPVMADEPADLNVIIIEEETEAAEEIMVVGDEEVVDAVIEEEVIDEAVVEEEIVDEEPEDDEIIIAEGESGSCGTNVAWNLDADGTLTIDGEGTTINSGAFSSFASKGQVKKIVVGGNVTTIPQDCFKNFSALKEIVISDKVTTIGVCALAGCTSLEKITMPLINYAEYVSYYHRFTGVLSDETMLAEGEIRRDFKEALAAFDKLEEINISSVKVTTTIPNCFAYLPKLKKVTLPAALTKIDASWFAGCTSLESVNFEELTNLSKIGEKAFYGCESLDNVKLLGNVKTLDAKSFAGCSALSSLEIGGANSIDDYAFEGCESLTEIVIPDSVTTFGIGALAGCTSLEKITMPLINYAEYVSYYHRFTGVLSDEAMLADGDVRRDFKEALEAFDKLEEINISSVKVTTTIPNCFAYLPKLKKVTLPKALTKIDASWFAGCTSLESVNFEELTNLSKIGEKAFYGCESLDNVKLLSNVKTLDAKSFAGCSALSSLEIGGANSIDDYAFEGCESLTEIVIPDSVTTLGIGALAGCTSLEKITMPLINYAEYVSYYHRFTGVLSKEAMFADGDVRRDFKDALAAFDKLEEINISSVKVTTIIPNCFAYLPKLKKVTLPKALTKINASWFEGCEGLREINTADLTNLTTVDNSAFKNCVSMNTIAFPETVTSFGDDVLTGCAGLYKVTNASAVELTLPTEQVTSKKYWVNNKNKKITAIASGTATLKGVNNINTAETVDSEVILAARQKIDVKPFFEGIEGIKKYTVKSTVKKGASVTKKGIMTAKKAGTITVTAWAKDGRIYTALKNVTFTVVKPEVTAMSSILPNQQLNAADYITYSELVTKYKGNRESVAAVAENGSVSVNDISISKSGRVYITAYFGEGRYAAKYKIKLTVKLPKLSAKSISLTEGKSKKLTMKRTDMAVTWRSEDEAVAMVGEDGKVYAMSVGNTNIVATVNGLDYKCLVVVRPSRNAAK